MKKLSDSKVKKKFKVMDDLKDFLFTEPQPYLNLDQIDYLLIGEENDSIQGLCQLCGNKSSILKKIKRSAVKSLEIIHSMLFNEDFYLREQI